mgnify:CR=1 FL=1
MPARQILFALLKKYPKTLVQKKAIAKHRSFSNQNALSIAKDLKFYNLIVIAIDALLILHSLSLVFWPVEWSEVGFKTEFLKSWSLFVLLGAHYSLFTRLFWPGSRK